MKLITCRILLILRSMWIERFWFSICAFLSSYTSIYFIQRQHIVMSWGGRITFFFPVQKRALTHWWLESSGKSWKQYRKWVLMFCTNVSSFFGWISMYSIVRLPKLYYPSHCIIVSCFSCRRINIILKLIVIESLSSTVALSHFFYVSNGNFLFIISNWLKFHGNFSAHL